MSYNLRYRKDKIRTKNFIPTIRYDLYNLMREEESKREVEYHPPIEEYEEVIDEDLIIVDDDDIDTSLLLEELKKELKKVKSVRKLEMWISKNKSRVNELTGDDRTDLLDFMNNKYYLKNK